MGTERGKRRIVFLRALGLKVESAEIVREIIAESMFQRRVVRLKNDELR